MVSIVIHYHPMNVQYFKVVRYHHYYRTRYMKLCPKLCHILTKFLWPLHPHFKKSNTIPILQNMSAFRICMIIIHSFCYKLWKTACFHQKWLKKLWNLVKSKSIIFLWTSISTTKIECLSKWKTPMNLYWSQLSFGHLWFYEITLFGGAMACFIWAIVVKSSYWENPIFLHITLFAYQKYMYIKN